MANLKTHCLMNRRVVHLVALTVLLMIAPALHAGAIQITLKDQVQVDQEQIRLGDVALIEPLDARAPVADGKSAEGAALGELVVARAPFPGRTRMVKRGDIETRLAKSGLKRTDYILAGSREVKVMRTATIVGSDRVEKLLEEALGAPVRLLTRPAATTLPEGTVSVNVLNAPRVLSAAPTALTFALVVNGVRQDTQTVIVAAGGPVANPAAGPQVGQTKAASGLALVRRGDRISVISRAGRIEIRAQGKALGDARLGEIVLVAVDWSKSPLKARVTDRGTASVE